MRYDLNDPAIVQMIEENHLPRETYTGVRGITMTHKITCRVDDEDWPCYAISVLRQRNKKGPS